MVRYFCKLPEGVVRQCAKVPCVGETMSSPKTDNGKAKIPSQGLGFRRDGVETSFGGKYRGPLYWKRASQLNLTSISLQIARV